MAVYTKVEKESLKELLANYDIGNLIDFEGIIEGTKAKSGVLDPLGAALDSGPGFYAELIRGMAVSIRNCLSEAS